VTPILFGTTCQSLLYGTLDSTMLFCNISTLCNRNNAKNKFINFRKAQRAACKGSKSRMRLASRSLATTDIFGAQDQDNSSLVVELESLYQIV